MAREWEKFVAHMKAKFPTKRRVVIRRVPMEIHGTTILSASGTTITVSIRAQDKLATQMETLCHEYGHVKEFDDYEEHGQSWGKAYAEAYSEMQKYLSDQGWR